MVGGITYLTGETAIQLSNRLEGLTRKWPNTRLITDARMALADGDCPFAVGAITKRAMAAEKIAA